MSTEIRGRTDHKGFFSRLERAYCDLHWSFGQLERNSGDGYKFEYNGAQAGPGSYLEGLHHNQAKARGRKMNTGKSAGHSCSSVGVWTRSIHSCTLPFAERPRIERVT